MESRDTVMSDREILELHKSITDSGIYAECGECGINLAIHMTEHHVTAQKQAEITWDVAIKEGRKEVVEWIVEHNLQPDYTPNEWLDQLKEWRL